jgi:ABC-type transport system substrate-binding protein
MRFANAEWDTEFAAGLAATTQETQAPHFRRCSEIFNDELPYVPMYQRVDYLIVGDNLRGPEKATITHPAAGGVRYWEWYIAS